MKYASQKCLRCNHNPRKNQIALILLKQIQVTIVLTAVSMI